MTDAPEQTSRTGDAATQRDDRAGRPPAAAPEVLRLEALERRFADGSGGHLEILRGADLVVREGELVALVAPSGAGKSTLLQIAGLLERPDGGEVYVAGVACGPLSDADRTLKRRFEIGFVYQFHHLLPEFSAIENIMMPQLIRGLPVHEAKLRSEQLLAYLRLVDRAEHRPAELSGGEQQRVAIARAVANAPRLLLADEPTGNLDPHTADHVFTALAKLVRASGLGALIATHNLDLARRMDRIVTLHEGVIYDLPTR